MHNARIIAARASIALAAVSLTGCGGGGFSGAPNAPRQSAVVRIAGNAAAKSVNDQGVGVTGQGFLSFDDPTPRPLPTGSEFSQPIVDAVAALADGTIFGGVENAGPYRCVFWAPDGKGGYLPAQPVGSPKRRPIAGAGHYALALPGELISNEGGLWDLPAEIWPAGVAASGLAVGVDPANRPALVTRDGAVTPLAVPGGALAMPYGLSVNSSGRVAGTCWSPNKDAYTAYAWENSQQATAISPLKAGDWLSVAGEDEAGEVVGAEWPGNAPTVQPEARPSVAFKPHGGGAPVHAWLWSPATGTTTDLNAYAQPGQVFSEATAISPNGEYVAVYDAVGRVPYIIRRW